MYQEAPDVPAGRILNLPITPAQHPPPRGLQGDPADRRASTSTCWSTRTRRSAGGTVCSRRSTTTRSRRSTPTLYITLLDNAESVHQRLMPRSRHRPHAQGHHGLARGRAARDRDPRQHHRGYGHFFMISRGRNIPTTQTIYRLMFERQRRRSILSFPMSHVMDLPDTLAEIDRFKADDQRAFHHASTRPTWTNSSCTRRADKAVRSRQGRRSKSRPPKAGHAEDRRGRADQRRHHGPDLHARFQDGRSVAT